LRTKSNMLGLGRKNKKGEQVFAFAWVGGC
jgi:hypothetical protein